MIINAEVITKYLEEGDKPEPTDPFVISPQPDLKELAESGSASVDLRLGTWFVTIRPARKSHIQIEDSEVQWQLAKTHYVPFGDQYYLHPGTFILGITLEWIRLPIGLGAYVIGKSSWGRRGLIIATATGVHPGFKGCLTLELSNVGQVPIEIQPGMKICQIFIHKVQHNINSEYLDRTQFVGSRKPRLGEVSLDDIARKLGLAHHSDM
jgi:dCTP deaminase